MHKLQCLNLSKQFLGGCFKSTLQGLTENACWRDSFKDQLGVSYKDTVYNKVMSEVNKRQQAGHFVEGIVQDKIKGITEFN